MRHLKRFLLVVFALLFLLEAWLWDHLEPMVSGFLRLIGWDRVKAKIAHLIEDFPPWAALIVFVVPVLLLLPFHALELVLLAKRRWFAAVLVIILAKLFGLGVTAFVFDATRHKLLLMPWFKRMYDWFIWARDWAHAQVEPIKARIQRYLNLIRGDRAGRFFRLFRRLRRRAQGV